MRRFISAAGVCAVLLAVPAVALAASHHGNNSATAGCSVSGGAVSASGLPTDQVINFFVTDSTGTTGWVLGFTPDGTWSVNVPPANGPTTYEFTSRTFGQGKYTTFSSCSA